MGPQDHGQLVQLILEQRVFSTLGRKTRQFERWPISMKCYLESILNRADV